MSDWFKIDDSRFEYDKTSKTLVSEPVQAEDIPYVDTDKLDLIEKASIERALTERNQHIIGLRRNIFDIQTERLALESHITELQDDHEQLRKRLREFETTRPSLEPNAVFRTFATSFDEVEQSLSDARYSVRDVDVTLKANVIHTDTGLRMHLPSLDERSATDNLSEISFRLHTDDSDAEPEPDAETYAEIPDLFGLSQAAAARTLAAESLTVGTVTTVDEPTEPAGIVIEQFPEPYLLAPSDASVDITVTETPVESETDQAVDLAETDPVDDASEAVAETISKTEIDGEAELKEQLRAAGIADLAELVALGPKRLADILGSPVETVQPLYDQLVAQQPDSAETSTATAEPTTQPAEEPLESIDGIGPTYAGRLTAAGITGVSSLARRDPETVADITRTSVSRSTDWIEQARKLSERR